MEMKAKKKIKVVCMGDSITEGYGLGEDTALFYPSRLQKLLGDDYEVFNQGVSGSCVTNTINDQGEVFGMPYARQDKYQKALDLKGEIYIILLGTNDAQDGSYDDVEGQDPLSILISFENLFTSYYQAILNDVKKANPNAKIYIGKPTPVMKCIWRKHQQKYLDILLIHIDEILRSNPECVLIDVYKAFRDYSKKPLIQLYQEDGLHPNEKGAELISNVVYGELIK